jgi:ion channel-forming bestrophin family protein
MLGLLLVFRTNTANDRFWEGRKLWGEINSPIRNISRHIWIMNKHQSDIELADKKEFLELLWLYALLVKNNLRDKTEKPFESHNFEHVSKDHISKIQGSYSQPLATITILQQKLMNYKSSKFIDKNENADAQKMLDNMVSALGGCERISKTPIPIAYSIHLKQLVLVYCLALPFQFVGSLGWFSVIAVMIISFGVMGIDEMGAEIEHPFGGGNYDLPLNTICEGIKHNIDDLMKS